MRDWNAAIYRAKTGFVSELGMPLLDMLGPRPGERVLDLGCGDGVLTRRLAEAGCEVIGIDASPDMVEAARGCGVDARLMNASRICLDERFDAVFSNAALHWMKPPAAVVHGVHRVLRPGGRFVAELGARGNIAGIRAALHEVLEELGIDASAVDPWYFPAPGEYAALLRRHGFEVDHLACLERPTPLPEGLAGWVESVARPFLAAVPESARAGVMGGVERRVSPRLRGSDGVWRADYVRLRIVARKSGGE